LKLFKKLCKKWCEKNNAELEWVKYIQKDIGLCFPEDRKKDLEEERAKSIPDPAKKRKNAIAWYIRGSRAKDDMILVIPEKYFGTDPPGERALPRLVLFFRPPEYLFYKEY
jgi:hypothetical protein